MDTSADVLQLIEESYKTFSKGQRYIADYICNNYVNVSKNSYSCNRWTEEVLDELVYHAILKQLKVIVDIKNQMKKFNKVYY